LGACTANEGVASSAIHHNVEKSENSLPRSKDANPFNPKDSRKESENSKSG
jgi:hypothetical protein